MPQNPHPPTTLLASERISPRPRLATRVLTDVRMGSQRRGAVAGRMPAGGYRRAEQGPAGPLVLEARPDQQGLQLQVWGPAATPSEVAEQALVATREWAGLTDDLTGFDDLLAASPVLREVRRHLAAPVLSRLPRAAESFGRAVLGQLVQGAEAKRSTVQLVALTGTPAPHGLTAWPTREALGSTPAHALRRCGIALRSASALHALAVQEGRFERLAAARAWHAMDEALLAIPGVGGWTSAETRLELGDPDAVSVGDYHIPALVGWVLGERTEDDASMLELLAPFAGHRGRVIRLLEQAAHRGLVQGKPRRGHRQALSAHRYW